MKNDLSCEVVQDLLPSYVDGLTSEITKDAVESHLNGCEMCSQRLRGLRESLMPKDESADESWNNTVDAMAMNRQVRYLLYGVLITLIVVLLLWIGSILLNNWVMTNHNAGFAVTPTSWNIEVNEENGIVHLEVVLPDGRAFKNDPADPIATYNYNASSKELTINITCSYVWGASGESAEKEFCFFDLFQEYKQELGGMPDYVTEIYIDGIDEPVWTAEQAR